MNNTTSLFVSIHRWIGDMVVLNDQKPIDNFWIGNAVLNKSGDDRRRVVTRHLSPSITGDFTLCEVMLEPCILDNILI